MPYQQNISLEEAIDILLSHTPTVRKMEHLPLLHARDRILAEDIYASFSNPPFDRAPIDGYACRAADLCGASREAPATLSVVEEIDAGGWSARHIQPGEAVRIMTGAAIPAGCDCCVRQESTDYGEKTVQIFEAVPPHGNYCDAGEDFAAGTCMLQAGEKLGFVELGLLASMGLSEVPVYALPSIALFTTGNECSAPGEHLAPGKIYNSNFVLLCARLAELGLAPFRAAHLPDAPQAVADAIREAITAGADLIITTGGVSVGKKDILHEALPLIHAEKLFWRVKLKPGTPTIFSLCQNVPIVSLSGNPFGALANLELLVRPMLAKLTRDASLFLQKTTGILQTDFPKKSPGRRFLRARYEDGCVYLPEGLHSSGVLASMQGCNCLVDIPAGSGALRAGEPVNVWMLPVSPLLRGEQTKKTPIVCAISGVKNSGKTTLLTRLLPLLKEKGLRIACIKHDGHPFDPDVPGTDSHKVRSAGADSVAIYSDSLSMVIKKEQTDETALLRRFSDMDLVLLEGFKWTDYPKIEVVREGNSDAPVCEADTLLAIATDKTDTAAFPADVPVYDLNAPQQIAALLLAHCHHA